MIEADWISTKKARNGNQKSQLSNDSWLFNLFIKTLAYFLPLIMVTLPCPSNGIFSPFASTFSAVPS